MLTIIGGFFMCYFRVYNGTSSTIINTNKKTERLLFYIT